jgi:hypothetical protein
VPTINKLSNLLKTMTQHQNLINTQVTWTSSYTKKTGKILAFVPAGISVADNEILISLGINWTKTKISQPVSQIDRFLIVVQRTSKNGEPLKSHYYAASASVILKAIEASE